MTITVKKFIGMNTREQASTLLILQREAYSNPVKGEELAQLRAIYWHGYNNIIKEIENKEVGR